MCNFYKESAHLWLVNRGVMSTFNAGAELFILDSPRLTANNLKANVDKLWWNSVFVTRPLTPRPFLEFSLPTYSVLITFKSLRSLCLSFLVAIVLWEWGWTELLWSHAEDHSTQLTAKGQVKRGRWRGRKIPTVYPVRAFHTSFIFYFKCDWEIFVAYRK